MASRTSLIGALGMGKQTVKGTAQSTLSYMPATSVNLQMQQQVSTIPPEVGGSYFLRGSYKASAAAAGDASFVVRPDSIGHLLMMLCGSVADVANNGTTDVANPGSAPTGTSNTGTGSAFALNDVVKVAYSWVTAGGETQISPLGSFTVAGAGNNVVINALTPLPTNVTGVNYYVSQTNGSTTLLKYNVTVQNGASYTITGYGTGAAVPSSDTGTYPDGTYTHTFNPFAPGAGNDLPWYTMVKDVAKVWAEQYVDMKMALLRLDMNKQQIAMGQASFFGITPSEITVPVSETFDTTPVFQICKATVNLTDEASVLTLPATATQAERITFDFNSSLSQDEFIVGSYYTADVTLLQRTATISYDIVIRDKVLREAVYQNGGTSAWDPTVFRGALTVSLASAGNITGSARPYSLNVVIPGMDFLMMPVALQGAQLIRANLASQVTLGPSGTDQFSFVLTNDKTTY